MGISLEFRQNFKTAWKKLVNEDLRVSQFTTSPTNPSQNRTDRRGIDEGCFISECAMDQSRTSSNRDDP